MIERAKHITTICFLGLCLMSVGQVPEAFNYQGVARDASGFELANHPISLRISIRTSSETGPIEFQEVHSTTTNNFGLFNIQVGNGGPVIATLGTVDWSNGQKWLQIEMDTTGGTDYVDMGSSQLLSTPYALYAGNAGGATALWMQDNDTLSYNSGPVGIGTESPSEMLTVDGVIETTGDGIRFSDGTLQTTASINPPSAADTLWDFDGSNFHITEISGNVGIGTLNPAHKLTVNDTIEIASGGLMFPDGSVQVTAADSAYWKRLDGNTLGLSTTDNVRINIPSDSVLENSDVRFGVLSNAYIQGAAVLGIPFWAMCNLDYQYDPTRLGPNARLLNRGIQSNTGSSMGLAISSYDSQSNGSTGGNIILNNVNAGFNAADFSIQVEYNGSNPTDYREVARFTSEGNVGIGSTSPSAALEIIRNVDSNDEPFLSLVDSSTTDGRLIIRDGTSLTNAFSPVIEAFSNGTGIDRAGLVLNSHLSEDGSDDAGIIFRAYGPGKTQLVNSTAFQFKNGAPTDESLFEIKANGNVGINNQDAKEKLHITEGNIYLDNASNGVIMTSPDGTCYLMQVANGGTPTFNAIACP